MLVKSLTDVPVRVRLYGLLCLLGGLLLVIGGLGLYELHTANIAMQTLYEEELAPQKFISTISSRSRDVALAIDKAVIAGDRRSKVNARASIRMHREDIDKAWKAYHALKLSADEGELAEQMWARYRELQQVNDAIFDAFAAGDMERARRVRVQQLDEATAAVAAACDRILAMQNEHAEHLTHDSKAAYLRNRLLIMGMILAGLTLAAVFGSILARSIMQSLQTAVRVSGEIAQGQLGHHIEVHSTDELGALLRGLQEMDGRLNDVVTRVRGSATAVGSAADQLSRGNDDLSQRTQEQASALEETAASMEQMHSTVKQNADNASQAERLAQSARNQAEGGAQEVQRTIAAMSEINQASSKIADIIGVIDEIAFQTNLLALNAAVEAARAGEQGRGFAVVATEVRNLAQRSAAAAKETKELINASLNKVKTGAELVNGSGRTLSEIMDSVKKVSDIVAEIAAASREQAAGVDQVNNAVAQMDETTQQNAALVEEAAAASKSLQQQARELLACMSFFGQAAAAATQSPSPSSSAAPAAKVVALKPTTRARPKTAPKAHVASTPARASVAKASGDDGAWDEF